MLDNKIKSILIVSDQFEQIELINMALKSKMVINTHVKDNIHDVEELFEFQSVDLVIVDDVKTIPTAASIKSIIEGKRKNIPILQLLYKASNKLPGEFIRGGANLSCTAEDPLDILANSMILIDLFDTKKSSNSSEQELEEYKTIFLDLYSSLSDPVCYLADGVFVSVNPAFLRSFKVADEKDLDELTILDFVDRKEQTALKNHLRKSMQKDMSSSPATFHMRTKDGKQSEFVIMSKPSRFNDESVVQVYIKSTSINNISEVGVSLFDEVTGLSTKPQMDSFLENKVKSLADGKEKGTLAYLMIKNFRDIWSTDGYSEAAKFIKAVTIYIKKSTPARTEISRYTDDGLLIYIPDYSGDKADVLLTELVLGLDSVTPNDMERMVEPLCFVGHTQLDKDSDYQNIIARVFRSARNNAFDEGLVRVSEVGGTEVSKKDTKRVEELQDILRQNRFVVNYQPIVSFDPDEMHRYRERVSLLDEDGEKLENSLMFTTAERYGYTSQIDKWKIEYLLQKILTINVEERRRLQLFINISADSLASSSFVNWLIKQLKDTGISGSNLVFEIMIDSVLVAYNAAIRFSKDLKKTGAKIALSRVGNFSEDTQRVIGDIKPNVIKLDIREISTFDEDSGDTSVITAIKAKAEELDALIIAEYLSSPAQLSVIWPHGITYIQGDGMTPLLGDMDFDFSSFDI